MTDESSAGDAAPLPAKFFLFLGVAIIIAVFGGLTAWSVAAPIDGAVIANGEVVVESQRKTVQHLEGGMINDLRVREGDAVSAGEVLARLDDTVPKANLTLIDDQLAELYARRVRLEAEQHASTAFETPRGVADVLAGAAFAQKLEGQNNLFVARRTTRLTQTSLLEERIVQQKERIAGLKVQIASLREQRRLIVDELSGVRSLFEQGYAPKSRLRALEREAERLAGERGALKARVSEAGSIIAEAKLEINGLKDSNLEDAIAELRDLEVSIGELEERRITAADELKRTEITAPTAGRVIDLSVHTIGGVVDGGAPIMQIVPQFDRLQISARIKPSDVNKIRPGQETLIRFSAFNTRRTPEARGVVKQVSADRKVDDKTGAPYFIVIIDMPEEGKLSSLLEGEMILPGMPVEAFIRTGSKSAISYFIKPLGDAIARSMREE